MPRKISTALISVFDKTDIKDLAKFLINNDVKIISTGGTAKTLRAEGISVVDISEITEFPEMLDGRVKTLHPKIHAGLLACRDNAAHLKTMEGLNLAFIDLVVVNLYPFESNPSIDMIDIGGPTMVRAAAKNYQDVNILTNFSQYKEFMELFEAQGATTTIDQRREWAKEAFAMIAGYDAAIANWFEPVKNLPKKITISAHLKQTLRYGENPHQNAGLYEITSQLGKKEGWEIVQGKPLSYNNIIDAEAAFDLANEFDKPAVAIIKHTNPCGVSIGTSLLEAYQKALECDPTSAYGGVVAMNRPLDKELASELSKIFLEVIIAPGVMDEAAEFLKTKKNLRVILADAYDKDFLPQIKTVSQGLLLQSPDEVNYDQDQLKVVTKRQPTKKELEDLQFAFSVCKHVKSNAIVYVQDQSTIGIGAGQMSRVDSSKIAAWKMKERKANDDTQEKCVVASDAFFPFADGVIAAAKAGATAVIQPGGSIRDEEVIKAANDHNMAMVFTQIRHFRH